MGWRCSNEKCEMCFPHIEARPMDDETLARLRKSIELNGVVAIGKRDALALLARLDEAEFLVEQEYG